MGGADEGDGVRGGVAGEVKEWRKVQVDGGWAEGKVGNFGKRLDVERVGVEDDWLGEGSGATGEEDGRGWGCGRADGRGGGGEGRGDEDVGGREALDCEEC